MTSAAEQERSSLPARLGFTLDDVVLELGWDEDADDDLREAIKETTGKELADEELEDTADVVLLWFREVDGDLVDILSDVTVQLKNDGHICLLTPKTGREGHVEPSDIAESASTAALTRTTSINAGPHWTATRLAAPKAARRKQQ